MSTTCLETLNQRTSAKTDSRGRVVDYLRLAVTDRCNLCCIYCMPPEGIPKLIHKDILSYEELLRLATIARSLGISKIRITGGEPLVRKGIVDFVRRLVDITNPGEVTMTTNGVLLADLAKDLFQAGIKRINISLDTLKPERFREITRRDAFYDVIRGIEKAMEVGFQPVKLNVVVMKGINDDEVEDLARLTIKEPFHVRFIEFMPFGGDEWEKRFLPADEIIDRIKSLGEIEPTVSLRSNGPARYMRIKGGAGKIGIISPMTHHFCNSCNRLRITPKGNLRTCLFSKEETDLRGLLRDGVSDGEIAKVILDALRNKPANRAFDVELLRKCITRPMSKIGG
ncbi:MAG: GTP 3',8-cyclase MoaA [Thermodesulforhabdaceae bacterium]